MRRPKYSSVLVLGVGNFSYMWLDRFRRPRWQHRNPKIRCEAVASLATADPDEHAILVSLAVDDPASVVRVAAVKRLVALETLRQRAQEDTDATVRETAQSRYCELLAEGCEVLDCASRVEVLQACQDSRVLARVARLGREEAIRMAALEGLDDPVALEEIICNETVARVCQSAIERIRDEAVLERLERRIRPSEGKIARRLREHLDSLRYQRARLEAAERERLEVVVALETLAEQPPSTTVDAERQRLLNRWQAQDEESAKEELRQRLEAALNALDSASASALNDESQPSSAEDLPEASTAAEAEHTESLETVLDEVIACQELSSEAVARVERLLAGISAESNPDGANGVATRARLWLDAARRYLEARPALDEALAQGAAADYDGLYTLEQRIAWPDDFPPPASLQQGRQLLASHQKSKQNRQQQERKAHLQKLQHQLDELEGVLDEGRLRPARRMLQRAEHLANGFEGGLPAKFERRIRHATTRIAELRDWRRFAVLPKQETLCRTMETLAESDVVSPPDRARRIRDLQSEWKATGGSDSSQSRALWERFSRAADQAFEPCRVWFEAEAQRRQTNLAERERICAQLDEFVEQVDWDSIAAGALERIRHTARKEWQHFGPVDRERLEPLRQRFEALMEKLTQQIEAKRAIHRAHKAELVDKAQALLEHEDPEAAAEQAKQLQQEWKALGVARPSADRALWKAFRTACDGIFANRDAHRERRRSQRNRLLEEVETICAQFEALVGESGPTDITTLRREAGRLQAAFRAQPSLHGRKGRAIKERFEAADSAVAERIQELEKLGVRHELAELRRLAELSRAWENGTGEAISPGDVTALPKWLLEPLQRRWEAAKVGDPKAPEPEASRRICVRLEILAGIDSPPADEGLRLELQVKRLSEGMGSGEQPLPRQEAQRLVAQWYGLPGGEALQGRVDAALERLF